MSARRPSSTGSRRRGAMCTPSPAIRRKQASTASTASAGESSFRTSLSERNRVRRLILLDEADLSARLEHGPPNLVERVDLLKARLRGDLLLRQPVAAQVLVDHLAVLDQDQRLAFEDRTQAPETPRQIREDDSQDRDRSDGERHSRHGEVVLRHALLHEIADRHEQDQVERLERVQLTPSDDAGQQQDEEKRDGCSNDDVHQGKIVMSRSIVVSSVEPSYSATSCERRPMFVGLTCSCMKRM